MYIDQILNKLDKVRKSGKGYSARCPAHEDKNPSLLLSELPDGRILIKCLAGCSGQEILQNIGLSLSDLYPQNGLGYYRSLANIDKEIQQKKANKVIDKKNHYELILSLAKSKRESGEKLSDDEMRQEKQAFLALREFTK